jgi:ribonuclease HII
MLTAGVDEAGRGTLFGRVYAAAVIWNPDNDHQMIKDSKKMTITQREHMKDYIEEFAVDFGIGYAEPREIDQHNIQNATFLAMHRAIENLNIDIDLLMIDGNRFLKFKDIDHMTIVQGDNKHSNIAAASILAKEYHDKHIKDTTELFNLHKYGLLKHMGYATKLHKSAIREYGLTVFHRNTFKST